MFSRAEATWSGNVFGQLGAGQVAQAAAFYELGEHVFQEGGIA